MGGVENATWSCRAGRHASAIRAASVAWDEAHDTGTEGAHHARIVRFLKDHEVGAVVVGHMGAGMHHTIQKMGLAVHTGAEGNARDAVVTATQA